MKTTKGKVATKGQKKIAEDNKSTLRFYSLMSIGALSIYLVTMFLFFSDQITFWTWVLTIFIALVYMICLSVMKYMARPTLSSTGQVTDGGIDLNMEHGFAEHLKDLIIFSAIIQVASLISSYFWYFWLLAPGRICYLVWVNFLGPWFFQEAPAEEVNEKKQKKLERRMRRMN